MVNSHYPFQSRFLDRGGIRQHYLDEGQGAPVVMVHGNPTWSYYYRRLILALRDRFRCIVPDHVGCGLSDKPGDRAYSYTLARRAADLESLLDHLEVRRGITLVVHDWGGMIGMTYATRHPERIARLVVLNTAAFRLPDSKRLPWSLALCRAPLLGPILVRGFNGFCRAAVRWCSIRGLSPEDRRAYLAPYGSWAHRIAILRFVQDIPVGPAHPSYELVEAVEAKLARLVKLPMLICWGGRDFVFDEWFLDRWLLRFPRAQVRLFRDAGHYLLEDAGGEICPLVREFLVGPEASG